jgi:DNA-binding MurR/RpiR family transcriptional regulator
MRYEKLKQRIQQSYNELPKNQQKVADFVLDNFDRIPFQGIQAVSRSTSASVATIVRFAQRIGFKGFSELREEIANTLQIHIENREIFTINSDTKISKDILTAVAQQDITNINETLVTLERKSFNKTIKMVINAHRIYTMGLGISNLMSQILAYQLNQIGYYAQAFRHDYVYFTEQVVFLKPVDVLIAFSFPPYSKETIDAAQFAMESEIPVVGITNRSTAPISRFSKAVLCVKSENMLFTNSFAAISVLINALSTSCARQDEINVKKMVEKIDAAEVRQNHLIK